MLSYALFYKPSVVNIYKLNLNSFNNNIRRPLPMKNKADKRVRIVSTLGPATRSLEMIEKLLLNGVNVFRLNFSHSEHHEHLEAYNNVREAAKKHNASVGVLADMQGPKLRVGKFKNDKATLQAGQTFILDLKDDLGDENRVKLPHKEIFAALQGNDVLLVDDGKIRLEVEEFGEDYAKTKVVVGGVISNSKGVNFPSGILQLSILTEKDLKDLEFALSLGVDYIGLSFIQTAEDVIRAKEIIKGRAKVVSKIEKPSALQFLAGIVKESDGIMVARGDLGVEVPVETVPVVQKQIIKECIKHNKPVIVATQMLDSMTNLPVPTRAEASDVANAVYDGADAVMLSGETTVGLYPVETVQTMARIINSVEVDEEYWDKIKARKQSAYQQHFSATKTSIGLSISYMANQISEMVGAKVIVAYSYHGTTINRISHQRPKVKILGVTDNPQLLNQSCLNWGVQSVLIEKATSFSEVVQFASGWLKDNGWVVTGDRIVVVASVPINEGGPCNSLKVEEIQ